jgi:hypothetical protein
VLAGRLWRSLDRGIGLDLAIHNRPVSSDGRQNKRKIRQQGDLKLRFYINIISDLILLFPINPETA